MKNLEITMDGRTVSYCRGRLYLMKGFEDVCPDVMPPHNYYPAPIEAEGEKCVKGVAELMRDLFQVIEQEK